MWFMRRKGVDLNLVRAVASGRSAAFRRSEAFTILAASNAADRIEILEHVATSTSERPSVRRVSAVALGRTDAAEAESSLLRIIGDTTAPGPVAADALRALGRVGSPRALKTIDAFRGGAFPKLTEAAGFGGALIAHRFRLEEYDLPLPLRRSAPLPRDQMLPMQISRANTRDMNDLRRSLGRKPYGYSFSKEMMARINCQGNAYTICLNESLAGDWAKSLSRRRAFFGIVGLYCAETARHSVCYVLLARPGPDGLVEVIAPHCSGRPGLTGHIDIRGKPPTFQLWSVDRPGAIPIHLEGTFGSGGLRFTAAISATSAINRLPLIPVR